MLPSRSISRWCAACICLCVCASHSSACHCLLRLLLFLCVSSDSNRGSSLVNCLAVVDTGIVDEAGFTFAKGYSGAGGAPTLCNLPPSPAHIMRQLLLVVNLREVCCSAGLSLRQGQRSLCVLQRMEEHRAVRQNGLFFEFSLCLSPACLGKMIIFIYKWLKKPVFSGGC
jgi:hypothetical protein